jgi:hypothetical protein
MRPVLAGGGADRLNPSRRTRRFRRDRPPLALNALRQTSVAKAPERRHSRAAAFADRLRQISDRSPGVNRIFSMSASSSRSR